MMPTDLTKPNAKQIIQMPTDLLGIWLRQILRHHTDAISTVFVERILVQQQLKIPYFQKKTHSI